MFFISEQSFFLFPIVLISWLIEVHLESVRFLIVPHSAPDRGPSIGIKGHHLSVLVRQVIPQMCSWAVDITVIIPIIVITMIIGI